jgi:acetyl esterase/lipase
MNRRQFTALLPAALLLTTSAVAQEHKHFPDVVYGHKLGVALTMDITQSAKPNGLGILWMVSGGWVSSHSSINPQWAKAFADRGFTVFQVCHGSAPKFTLPEIMQDIHAAVRFVRMNASKYGVDPNRLGIAGGSAGGHLSLMMAAYGDDGNPAAKDEQSRQSSKVQAVACFYPPTDFLNYGKEGVAAMSIPALKVFQPVFGITDSTPQEEKVRLAKTLSPIYGFNEKTCPILIIHGDADMLVPIQQSQIVMSKLEALKVPHKLVVREGKAHGWPGIEKDITILMDWFEEHLGNRKQPQH